MALRAGRAADEAAIREVHQDAFGPVEGPVVADLALALLHDPSARPLTSLVACRAAELIGHVLFTRVRIEGQTSGQTSGPARSTVASILAPLAVRPGLQRQGIGSRLVRRGLAVLAAEGCGLVFVLGHPGFYPRFGFRPAAERGFLAPYPIAPEQAEAWMVLALCDGVVGAVAGSVVCADCLRQPQHWSP
ncbi:MAG: N-acetyltransferase [Cyanobium sp. PLM2.Bin73]|nr:MAG: N-acetyltransferase [Cyanobium sp. PLM2.Bin73]